MLPLRSLRELGSVSGDFRRRASRAAGADLHALRPEKPIIWHGNGHGTSRVAMHAESCTVTTPIAPERRMTSRVFAAVCAASLTLM